MCGLLAIINSQLETNSLVARSQKAIRSMYHRGPDNLSVEEIGHSSVFAHTRLSILDLSDSANMPLSIDNDKLSILFNGQIYNHNELRKSLIQKGCRFSTASDTEVILNGYKVWGENVVDFLDGMYAFVIYDKSTSRFFIARDRLGIKPLYFTQYEGSVYFASEMKAIFLASNLKPEVEKSSVNQYFSFQNFINNDTLFKNVFLFPAGSYCFVNENSFGTTAAIEPIKFWSPQFNEESHDETELQQKIKQTLTEAVSKHAEADVQVNSFLSSGLDSSTIASLLSQLKGDRFKTFTCGFDHEIDDKTGNVFDERHTAHQLAQSIRADHYETQLNASDFLRNIEKWAYHAEEPRVGSSFPNYWVSKLGSQHSKVCLSGTGSDEIFGGYIWRYNMLKETVNADQITNQINIASRKMFSSDEQNHLMALNKVEQDHINDCLYDIVRGCYENVNARSHIATNTYLLFEMQTFLQGLLIVEDKASMANGLEIRVPFLDNNLIDLASTISAKLKIGQNQNNQNQLSYGLGSNKQLRTAEGKKILRDSVSDILPNELLNSPKQGFSPPFELWYRNELSDYLHDSVFNKNSNLAKYLDISLATKKFTDHLAGANYRSFIWGALAFELSIAVFADQIIELQNQSSY